MTSCCVPGCLNRRTEKNKFEISFHNIPKRPPDVRQKWLDAIGRPGWEAYKATVCSAHFKDSDFGENYSTAQRRTIPKTSIPSLNLPSQKGINVSEYLSLNVEERIPRKRKATPRYSSEIYELDSDVEEIPSKKVKLSTTQISGERQRKQRFTDHWTGSNRPNEKPTQTCAADWKLVGNVPSNKQVQADLCVEERKFWYLLGGLETKKVDDFHCSSAADHRSRYRIDVLYNELHRLKSMKHAQDRLIEHLQCVLKPSKIIERHQMITQHIRDQRSMFHKERPTAPHTSSPSKQAPPQLVTLGETETGEDAGAKVVDEVAEMLAQLHGEGGDEGGMEDPLSVVYVNNMDVQCTTTPKVTG